MWSNGIKTAFFSKKLRKIAQQLGAEPPSAGGYGGLGSGTSPPDPLNNTFELQYTSLLNTSPNSDIFTF